MLDFGTWFLMRWSVITVVVFQCKWKIIEYWCFPASRAHLSFAHQNFRSWGWRRTEKVEKKWIRRKGIRKIRRLKEEENDDDKKEEEEE